MMMKRCNKCNEIKDIICFGKRKVSKDGYRNYCKSCHQEQQTESKRKNLDKYTAREAKYYIDNKDTITSRNKDWYDKNKEQKLSVAKIWRDNNKEKAKEISRKWREKNKDKIREKAREYRKTETWKVIDANKSHRRRIQKKSTCNGSVTTESLLLLRQTQDDKCYHCGIVLDMDTPYMVHLDHLIPLVKGGNHTIENVVWSCRTCNLIKGSK